MTSVLLDGAKEAILSRWASAWGSTTPYVFQNEQFTPPNGSVWARLTILHDDSRQETLGPSGGRRFLRAGTVFVDLFAPIGSGTTTVDALATLARSIFEGVSFDGLRFPGIAIVRELGEDEFGFFQIQVEALFDYEETK